MTNQNIHHEERLSPFFAKPVFFSARLEFGGETKGRREKPVPWNARTMWWSHCHDTLNTPNNKTCLKLCVYYSTGFNRLFLDLWPWKRFFTGIFSPAICCVASPQPRSSLVPFHDGMHALSGYSCIGTPLPSLLFLPFIALPTLYLPPSSLSPSPLRHANHTTRSQVGTFKGAVVRAKRLWQGPGLCQTNQHT